MEDLLENYPLYKKVLVEEDDITQNVFSKLPAITAFCEGCNNSFTFNPYSIDGQPPSRYNAYTSRIKNNDTFRVIFICRKCNKFQKEFLIRYTFEKKTETDDSDGSYGVYATKVGQYPAYSIQAEEAMRNYLDKKNLTLYQHGIICESQSYGVGAFAYYRQIIENQIGKLLDEILAFAEESQREELKHKIEQAKEQPNTTEKINIVKDILPSTLRPGGNNVLGSIYGALSDGLHNKSDEDCLEISHNLRTCLVFLIKKIEEHKRDERDFATAYKTLQKKTNNKPLGKHANL